MGEGGLCEAIPYHTTTHVQADADLVFDMSDDDYVPRPHQLVVRLLRKDGFAKAVPQGVLLLPNDDSAISLLAQIGLRLAAPARK